MGTTLGAILGILGLLGILGGVQSALDYKEALRGLIRFLRAFEGPYKALRGPIRLLRAL